MVGTWGNPGSLHSFGQKASAAVFNARRTIADSIGAHYSEIIFTGSATEANNLALRGTVRRFTQMWTQINAEGDIKENFSGRQRKVGGNLRPRIVISAVEHESILKTAKDLEQDGVEVIIISVSKEGIADLKKLKSALNERTVLVSMMLANNEVGTVQPIVKIAEIIRDFRESKLASLRSAARRRSNPGKWIATAAGAPRDDNMYPLFHTDAVQAFQYLDCNVNALGVDMLTLSGQKIYGPKGIGCLYIRNANSGSKLKAKSSQLEAIITGGGQEEGLRSGTENVPSIVGMAKAVELATVIREKEAKRVAQLSHQLIAGIKRAWPGAQLNGPSPSQAISYKLSAKSFPKRLPNNIHLYFPGKPSEELMVALDLKGISVATGPACSARTAEPSHVLLAMGYSKERAMSSLRITLGRQTTAADLDVTLKAIRRLR